MKTLMILFAAVMLIGCGNGNNGSTAAALSQAAAFHPQTYATPPPWQNNGPYPWLQNSNQQPGSPYPWQLRSPNQGY